MAEKRTGLATNWPVVIGSLMINILGWYLKYYMATQTGNLYDSPLAILGLICYASGPVLLIIGTVLAASTLLNNRSYWLPKLLSLIVGLLGLFWSYS